MISKSQNIRLVDVLLLGPFMIYAGTKNKLTDLEKTVLIGSGVLTILYNFKNYRANL